MSQPRVLSLMEAASNIGVGYVLAVGLQIVLFPLFGFAPSITQNLKIGLAFTLVSLVRSYALRRLFERFSR